MFTVLFTAFNPPCLWWYKVKMAIIIITLAAMIFIMEIMNSDEKETAHFLAVCCLSFLKFGSNASVTGVFVHKRLCCSCLLELLIFRVCVPRPETKHKKRRHDPNCLAFWSCFSYLWSLWFAFNSHKLKCQRRASFPWKLFSRVRAFPREKNKWKSFSFFLPCRVGLLLIDVTRQTSHFTSQSTKDFAKFEIWAIFLLLFHFIRKLLPSKPNYT